MASSIFDTKGNLFKNNNHKRDTSVKLDRLTDEVLLLFRDCQRARRYLENIKVKKSRYFRDQLTAIKNCVMDRNPEIVSQTLVYCENNRLYSASDFKDVLQHFDNSLKMRECVHPSDAETSIHDDVYLKLCIKPEIRDIEVYKAVLNKQAHIPS